jgi:hypothetical protein
MKSKKTISFSMIQALLILFLYMLECAALRIEKSTQKKKTIYGLN